MYEYSINEAGEYVLDFDSERVVVGKTVAIAFDREDGFLMKHGNPDLVNKWADAFRKKMLEAYPRAAETLIVIEGPFSVEELNKMLGISDYIGTYYRRNYAEKGTGVDVRV